MVSCLPPSPEHTGLIALWWCLAFAWVLIACAIWRMSCSRSSKP